MYSPGVERFRAQRNIGEAGVDMPAVKLVGRQPGVCRWPCGNPTNPSFPCLARQVNFFRNKTPANATIAAAMTVTSFLLPLADRAVVNHPHYEHAAIRERTYEIYQIYAGQPDSVLWAVMRRYRADYLVLDVNRCEMAPRAAPDSFRALYDRERPDLVRTPPFCMRWAVGENDRKTPLFSIVYVTPEYMVLRVTRPHEIPAGWSEGMPYQKPNIAKTAQ